MAGDQVRPFLPEDAVATALQFVKTLAEGAFRGDVFQSQSQAKELVLPERFDGLEVGLAQVQQADHRSNHVSMRDLGPLAIAEADDIAPALNTSTMKAIARMRSMEVP